MYDQITQIVTEFWIEQNRVPESMTPQLREQFLAAETDRIAEMIQARIVMNRERMLAEYVETTGRPLDYSTKTALIEQARREAFETVIAEEVHEQDDQNRPFPETGESAEQVAERDRARIEVNRSDPNRWMQPLNCRDSSTRIDRLARTLWPNNDGQYRMLGSALLQARTDDDQPIPTSATDPLLPSFTAQLDQAMVATGRAGRTGRGEQ